MNPARAIDSAWGRAGALEPCLAGRHARMEESALARAAGNGRRLACRVGCPTMPSPRTS